MTYQKDQFLKNRYKIVTKERGQIGWESSLVPDPEAQTALPREIQGQRARAYLATVREVWVGRADLAHLIYSTYINTLHTQQAPGPRRRLPTEPQDLGTALGSQKRTPRARSPAQGEPCSEPTPRSAV